jgi:hypothetical protein
MTDEFKNPLVQAEHGMLAEIAYLDVIVNEEEGTRSIDWKIDKDTGELIKNSYVEDNFRVHDFLDGGNDGYDPTTWTPIIVAA